MKTVVYKTTKIMGCSGSCNETQDIVVCLDDSLTVSGFGYIDATLTAVTLSGESCGAQIYSYYIEYNESQLANPSRVLLNADIKGVICDPCLISYIRDITGTSTGCFACENSNICVYPEVYPECYGAVGNGSHDDTAAFAELISEHPSNVDIVIPYGKNYLVDQIAIPITSSNLRIRGIGTITGSGNKVIITVGDTTTQNSHATNISLEDFNLVGAGSTDNTLTSQSGIAIYSVLGCRIKNVRVTSMPHTGIIGTKSQASGATYWNKVSFIESSVRFCGRQLLNIGTDAAADDLTTLNCLFNHGGERLSSDTADGAVYIKAISLSMSGDEISGNYSATTPGAGYRWGMRIATASGLLAGLHYEINGNNLPGSADLLLDTNANGLCIEGSNHYGQDTKAAKYCIQTTSKNNVINGVSFAGNGTHSYDYIVEGVNATNLTVGPINQLGANGPNTAWVNTGGYGKATSVAYDNYVQTGRRRERFQTRYSSSNPANIVITGWGTTATVTAVRAYDSHGDFTINATGTGQTNPATIEITFLDGAWTSEPTCIMYERTTGSGGTLSIPQVAISATRILFTANSAPVAGATYTFTWHCIGME